MKLIKSFESIVNQQPQVIELTCEVNSRLDVEVLGYADFKANLFLDGRYIADITPILDEAGLFNQLVDSVDWSEVYSETYSDLKHAS